MFFAFDLMDPDTSACSLLQQDKSPTAEMLDKNDYQYLYIFQRHRTAPKYEYDEAMTSNMVGTGPIELRIGRQEYCMSNKFNRKSIS